MKILFVFFLLSITWSQVLSNRSKRGIPAVFEKTVERDPDVLQTDPDISIDCNELGVTIYVSPSKIQGFIDQSYVGGISGYTFVGPDDDLIPGCNGSTTPDGSINVTFTSFSECSYSASDTDGDAFGLTYRLCLTPFKNSSSYILRDDFIVINLTCAFVNGILAHNLGLTPRILKVPVPGAERNVYFTTSFFWCQHSSCVDEYSSGDLFVGDEVYFKAVIPRGEENSIILQLWKCWATPDADSNTTPNFDLVVDGCPNEDVPAVDVMVPFNFESTEVRFSFKTFAWTHLFLSDIQTSYIHCILCYCKEDLNPEGNCTIAPTCGDRRRRSIDIPPDNQERVTVGPIQYKMRPCDKEELGCSHECSYDNSGTAGCTCPSGFFLKDDLKTCKAFEEKNFEKEDPKKIIFLPELKIISTFDHVIFIWYLLFALTILAVLGAVCIGCRSWKSNPISSKADGVTSI